MWLAQGHLAVGRGVNFKPRYLLRHEDIKTRRPSDVGRILPPIQCTSKLYLITSSDRELTSSQEDTSR